MVFEDNCRPAAINCPGQISPGVAPQSLGRLCIIFADHSSSVLIGQPLLFRPGICALSSSSRHPCPSEPHFHIGLPLPWSRWMESTGRSSSPHSSTNASLAVDVATEQHRQQSTNIGSPVVVPPYWQTHQRGESLISIDSNRLSNPFIRLVDNTEQASEQSKGLWAKSAQIAEYVVIRGAAPGIGDYVVWTCKVETLNVSLLLNAWPDNIVLLWPNHTCA